MNSLTLAQPAFWSRFSLIWKRINPSPRLTDMGNKSHEDERTRREFIHDMLNKNSDAFQSELDVQCMMGTFPEHF